MKSVRLDEEFGRAAGGALADLVTNPAGAAASLMDGADAFSDLPLDQQIETGLEVALTAVVPSGDRDAACSCRDENLKIPNT